MGMEVQSHVFLLQLLSLFILGNTNVAIGVKVIQANHGIGALNRSSFPAGFIFGTASSSYQVSENKFYLNKYEEWPQFFGLFI